MICDIRGNEMKVLVTGGTGLLGKALVHSCTDNAEIVATFVGEYRMRDNRQVRYLKLDIRDKNGYDDLFKGFKPDVVIHTAGIGSPDYAEINRELVTDINVNGTKNILELSEKYESKFIFISSNGIYDGNAAPYAEEETATPINYYGLVKLMGEKMTRKAKVPFAIIRPILMYGWPFSFERGNIVTLAISKLAQGETFHAYDDVYANPLFNHGCAEAIWRVINNNEFDAFNIAGADRVNIYGLLVKAAEVFGLDKDAVIPVQQGYFNELARRPRDTSFKTDKMEKVLGLKPIGLEEGLTAMKENRS